MSANQALISIYAALFAVALIARAVTGPITDPAGGKHGLYATAKAAPFISSLSNDVRLAASDAPVGQ
jgi:hypothetical protein